MLIGTDFRHTFGALAAPHPGCRGAEPSAPDISAIRTDGTREEVRAAPLLVLAVTAAAASAPRGGRLRGLPAGGLAAGARRGAWSSPPGARPVWSRGRCSSARGRRRVEALDHVVGEVERRVGPHDARVVLAEQDCEPPLGDDLLDDRAAAGLEAVLEVLLELLHFLLRVLRERAGSLSAAGRCRARAARAPLRSCTVTAAAASPGPPAASCSGRSAA